MSVERHELLQEDVGAYLLDALDDAERRRFEDHLQECPVCADEVERLRPAVHALPRSVLPVAPPPSLKASLMGVVEAEARERQGLGPRRASPLAWIAERLAAGGGGRRAAQPARRPGRGLPRAPGGGRRLVRASTRWGPTTRVDARSSPAPTRPACRSAAGA